jgi:hypothetical protein
MHTTNDDDKLRYPIGDYKATLFYDETKVKNEILTIRNFYELLVNETKGLTETDLQKTYRANGWSIKQVVHHCADSHMNGLIRLKLALTEHQPTIKPYPEQLFAELADTVNEPIESSLSIILGVHNRFTTLLESMNMDDFNKSYLHPQYQKEFKLYDFLGLYSWHCLHHLEHIKIAKKN